jgi:glycosyltransferase involved in cell wall biosynthesis
MRVALLSYRSKEHSGGQGVYVRHLSRGLAELGHEVTVYSGQPYPEALDPRVELVEVPSLDLYREPDPFRTPRLREFRGPVDVLEYLTMLTAGFPEPLTFTLRVARDPRLAEVDVVHDNQSLGYGLLWLQRRGIPLVATVHHPISRDRKVDIAAASLRKQVSVRRWYGFVRMQARVARRIPTLLTVSTASATDTIDDFGIDPAQMTVVPLGVDTDVFRPRGERVPGRIVAIASADSPLKGVAHLLEAVAKLRVERDVQLHLVSRIDPKSATARRIEDLGLAGAVTLHSGLSDDDLAALLASAEVMAVPSLYEGFSLPTVEALACGTPVVASRAGALPETVGDAARLVAPGDVGELTDALAGLLDDPDERARLRELGLARVEERYSWTSVARATVAAYQSAIDLQKKRTLRADR